MKSRKAYAIMRNGTFLNNFEGVPYLFKTKAKADRARWDAAIYRNDANIIKVVEVEIKRIETRK